MLAPTKNGNMFSSLSDKIKNFREPSQLIEHFEHELTVPLDNEGQIGATVHGVGGGCQ